MKSGKRKVIKAELLNTISPRGCSSTRLFLGTPCNSVKAATGPVSRTLTNWIINWRKLMLRGRSPQISRKHQWKSGGKHMNTKRIKRNTNQWKIKRTKSYIRWSIAHAQSHPILHRSLSKGSTGRLEKLEDSKTWIFNKKRWSGEFSTTSRMTCEVGVSVLFLPVPRILQTVLVQSRTYVRFLPPITTAHGATDTNYRAVNVWKRKRQPSAFGPSH